VFVATVLGFHTGKPFVDVTANPDTDKSPYIGTEESVEPLKSIFVHLGKGFKMILDTAVIVGSLWIARPIHGRPRRP
jgi:hypothetical protein